MDVSRILSRTECQSRVQTRRREPATTVSSIQSNRITSQGRRQRKEYTLTRDRRVGPPLKPIVRGDVWGPAEPRWTRSRHGPAGTETGVATGPGVLHTHGESRGAEPAAGGRGAAPEEDGALRGRSPGSREERRRGKAEGSGRTRAGGAASVGEPTAPAVSGAVDGKQ